MIKMHRSMKDVALFDLPSEINIAINAVNEQEHAVLESLDIVKKNILGDEGQKLENETRHLFANWKPIREEVIKLVREDQRKEAAKITMGKGADYVVKLENKMLELTSYARNKATGFMLHGEKVHSRVMKTTIILISIALLLSVFIAFLTIRRTQTAEEALRKAHDELEQRVEERTVELLQANEHLKAEIKERTQVEARLRETEFKYRTVADFTYDWEYWSNLDGTLRYVSPSCKRISGYKPEQFVDNPFLLQEIVVPEDRAIWDKQNLDSRSELKPREIQFRIRRRDGEIRWIEHARQQVTDGQGKILGFRGSNRDITMRKQLEMEAQRHRGELAHLVRVATHGRALRRPSP